ncbi:MAG: hypothetical protein J7604_13090 [Sporocytophaga sp.]|uniref:hypothetical protein n=1 Tax=Sporocytophaga sp. TaxID=2231183 RepID=UPI001B170A89|nr:hypothetical protein [Sporocytophaga sp.]MBO9701140.1 hypothetical protein [Sporocytophaga sp.]
MNINEPKFIRQIISQGIKNGWTGDNKLENQNGLIYLNELGCETSRIKPISPPNPDK